MVRSCLGKSTGEMSHHEVLEANADGVSIILTDHSNTVAFCLR